MPQPSDRKKRLEKLSSSFIVPITDIAPLKEPNKWGIKTMKVVLDKQGQIEPLQINIETNQPFEEDVHGDDIVYAARELNWSTLLCLFIRKYIP